MVYTRPSSIPYPKIWHRFEVTRGVPITLRVQDLTEDLFEPALDLLAKYFTRDEPPCKYIDVNSHPVALAELKKLWRETANDKLSLVCVLEDDPKVVVGVNVLTVANVNDKEEPFQTTDKVWGKLFGAVDVVSRAVNIFQHYGVEEYLTAYGLVVDPAWRGLGISVHLLKARIPLCKALGVKVTATVFTAGASQAVAKKAGFETLAEITYEELASKGFIFPGVEENTKSSKLMALVID